MKTSQTTVLVLAFLLSLGNPEARSQPSTTDPGRSVDLSRAPVTVLFENQADGRVEIFWVDFSGVERAYGSQAAGNKWRQESSPGHLWRFKDRNGRPLGFYRVSQERTQSFAVGAGGGADPEAQPGEELVFFYGGLKNLHRIRITEMEMRDGSFRGFIEIQEHDTGGEPHTRYPITGTILGGRQATGGERIEISSPRRVDFLPHVGSGPERTIQGTWLGRGTANSRMILQLYWYAREEGRWKPTSWEFKKMEREDAGQPDAGAQFDLARASLGGIRIGDSAAEVRRRLSAEIFTGDIFEEAATGATVQGWRVPEKGLQLKMSRFQQGPFRVSAVTFDGPGRMETDLGVGLGDPRSLVEQRYGAFYNRRDSEAVGANSFVAGSLYEGMIFRFDKNNRVRQIFMGAAAE